MEPFFFSVIVPTYNRANLITATIKSLLNQTYINFEIIIVDDGSTDNTEEIVRRINSNKISYYKIVNSERGFARNFGANKAKGMYVNFFDSDDLALNNHLEEAQKMVIKHNNPEIFHLNYALMNPSTGNLINKKWDTSILKELWRGNTLSCNGVFLKRETALKFPFNESRKLSVSEDWELWLRLAARYNIYLTNTVTSYIVDHNQRSVMQYDEQKLLDRKMALMEGLKNDYEFVRFNEGLLNKIEAHMLSYISLHAALSGYKQKSVKYLFKAIRVNTFEIFSKRFLAIIKHLFLK